MKKILFMLMAGLAVFIGLYPGAYFFLDRRFGLLQSKPDSLLDDWLWNTGFYIHIILGGIALLVGWSQFSSSLRKKRLNVHRTLGKIYVFCVLPSSVAAIGIGFFATGGWIAAVGFICLGITWFSFTLTGYRWILRKAIDEHQDAMIYSYGACFAAVTLRLWLPALMSWLEYESAYRLVAWLCWVPNVLVAHLIVIQRRKSRMQHELTRRN